MRCNLAAVVSGTQALCLAHFYVMSIEYSATIIESSISF
jgi:hypothetical protein